MTKEIILKAKIRAEANGKAKKILNQGYIPAVIYGSGAENKNLKIKNIDFERVFDIAGESNLIDLTIGNSPAVKVIVKDFQKDAVKGGVIHVDFYQVNMKKKIITDIPLDFIGVSRAIKELGGVLVKNIDEIEVECLPGNLVGKIEVDLSKLNDVSDMIRISDLKLPEGIVVINDQSEIVVSAAEQREIVEEKPQEAEEASGEEEEGEKAGEDGKEEKGEEGDKKDVKDEKK